MSAILIDAPLTDDQRRELLFRGEMPVYPFVSETAMAFHPNYWNHAVRKGPAGYNYAEWNRTSRQNAAQFIKEDTRKQPKPEEPMELDPQVRVIAPPGGVLLFSAAH